ncbi:MAG: phosphotransferase [Patescibacteria group bacterium]
MTNRYLKVTDIEQKIVSLLAGLKLEIIQVFVNERGGYIYSHNGRLTKTYGHHYYIAKVSDGQQLAVIKARIDLPSDPSDVFARQKNFANEQLLYSIAGKSLPFVPGYLSHGQDEGISWLLYRYVEGKAMGNTFLAEPTPHTMLPLTRQVSIFRATEKPANLNLKNRDSQFYREHLKAVLKYHAASISMYLPQKTQERILELNHQNQGTLDRFCTSLSHGDLHPGNIIINDDRVSLIDWETIHIDNYVADTAFLWLRLWNMPNWRNALAHSLFSDFPADETAELFRYIVLHNLIDEFAFWRAVQLENNLENPYTSVADAALKIHQQTLHAALENKRFWE